MLSHFIDIEYIQFYLSYKDSAKATFVPIEGAIINTYFGRLGHLYWHSPVFFMLTHNIFVCKLKARSFSRSQISVNI